MSNDLSIGRFVLANIPLDAQLSVREFMAEAHGDQEGSPSWSLLSNAGSSVPGDPPFTLEDVVLMLGRLADARVADQADWDRWLRLLAAVFGDGQEEAVAALYVRATGIPDTVMFRLDGW